MFHGLSFAVCIIWLLVFPGSLIIAGIFFKSNAWKKITDYYGEWLDPEEISEEK